MINLRPEVKDICECLIKDICDADNQGILLRNAYIGNVVEMYERHIAPLEHMEEGGEWVVQSL